MEIRLQRRAPAGPPRIADGCMLPPSSKYSRPFRFAGGRARWTRLGRPGLWWAAVLALAVAPLSGTAADAVADETVSLPPFIVEESVKGPPWRYAGVPGCEVLSRCPDQKTRAFFAVHDRLHQLLDEILPETLRLKSSVPKTLILYDESLQLAASQEVIARLLREAPTPPRLSEPLGFGGRRLRPAAARPRYRFVPNMRLWDQDAMSLFVVMRKGGFDGDSLGLTPHYIAYLLDQRVPALPAWFVAGFQTMFARASFERDRLVIAPLEWLPRRGAGALNISLGDDSDLLPLAEFFAAELSPREGNSAEELVALWQAQAALLARWGIDGGEARRRGWWKLVERSATEAFTEALFQECLGLDYAAARRELGTYRTTAVRRTLRFRPASLAPAPLLPLRDATPAQIGRIKGDWERMQIAYVKNELPALADKYREQAQRTLAWAHEREPQDAPLLAVLGLFEVDHGDPAQARDHLEAANRLGPLRPRAAVELARLRLDALRAAAGGPEARLEPVQAAAVLTPLFAARSAQPPLPEVYELIGETWAHCAATPKRAHLAVLGEGIRLFPQRPTLIRRAAELHLRHGYLAEARLLVDLGLRLAPDDPARDPFVALQRQLGDKP